MFAPTNDEFYEALQNTIYRRRGNHIGDCNAKLESNNTGYTATMGNNEAGVMDGNGKYLTGFGANNNIVINIIHTRRYARQQGFYLTIQYGTRSTISVYLVLLVIGC